MLVQHFLEDSAEKLPHKVALTCENQRHTYEQLNQRCNSLAASLTAREVIAYCVGHLDDTLVPKFVEFHDILPITETGKVRWEELRAAL